MMIMFEPYNSKEQYYEKQGDFQKWLSEWLENNKRHRTINDRETLVCSKLNKMIDMRSVVYFNHCPLCSTKLENPTEEENYNLSWEF